MSDHRTPPAGRRCRAASTPSTGVVARRRLGPRTERDDPVAVAALANDALDLGGGEDTHESFVGLVAEIRRRGWPVEVEQCWLDGEWVCYPGPARVGIGRSERFEALDGDPLEELGLGGPGPRLIHMSAPQELRRNGPGEFDLFVGADVGAKAAIDELASSLRSARWAGLALLRDDAACSLCNDAYPSGHLVSPDPAAPGVGVCPACIFDGDLVDIDAAYVAYQIDRLLLDDLAAPAGWSGVATLLATLGADNFVSQLAVEWENTGLVYLPMPFWDDADDSWIWINATTGPLSALQPATSTGRLAGMLAGGHPQRNRAERDFRARTGTRLSSELWSAALAYVVSFDTQARDRGHHRGPWHVLESFDATPLAWAVEGWVIQVAIDCVRKALTGVLGLAWDDYLGTDSDPERRGLAAAFALADHCEANGWRHVTVGEDEGESSQLINVEAMTQPGGHRLLARWSEDDDGRGHFVEAALLVPDQSEPVGVRTLREANRLVELHGSEAP